MSMKENQAGLTRLPEHLIPQRNSRGQTNQEVKTMKVECVGCERKFTVDPENFANYEIVFCPTCWLNHQIVKKDRRITVKAVVSA
jgi:Zn finger protein HypA/HybF involved in hydrogenase expression